MAIEPMGSLWPGVLVQGPGVEGNPLGVPGRTALGGDPTAGRRGGDEGREITRDGPAWGGFVHLIIVSIGYKWLFHPIKIG